MAEKTYLCAALGVIGSYAANVFGGWDYGIQTLLLFMAVDFILGFLCAAVWGKSPKSDNGALSSQACWKGIVKKCGTFLIVACCTSIDRMLSTDYVRNAVVIAFCVSELISICETAGIMGIMPKSVQNILSKVIDVLKGRSGGDDDEDN